MLFTTNRFLANLLMHLRSCQFTGELVCSKLSKLVNIFFTGGLKPGLLPSVMQQVQKL